MSEPTPSQQPAPATAAPVRAPRAGRDQLLFRAALAVVGTAVVGWSAWCLLTGVRGLPDTRTAGSPTLESAYGFFSALYLAVGLALVAIALRFRWSHALGLVCGLVFVGALGRVVSWALHGTPHWSSIVLMIAELVVPPVLLVWHGWTTRTTRLRRQLADAAG